MCETIQSLCNMVVIRAAMFASVKELFFSKKKTNIQILLMLFLGSLKCTKSINLCHLVLLG